MRNYFKSKVRNQLKLNHLLAQEKWYPVVRGKSWKYVAYFESRFLVISVVKIVKSHPSWKSSGNHVAMVLSAWQHHDKVCHKTNANKKNHHILPILLLIDVFFSLLCGDALIFFQRIDLNSGLGLETCWRFAFKARPVENLDPSRLHVRDQHIEQL